MSLLKKMTKLSTKQQEAPNGGLTFSSQHNAEVSEDAANLWSFEFDGCAPRQAGAVPAGAAPRARRRLHALQVLQRLTAAAATPLCCSFNVENCGKGTLHNLKVRCRPPAPATCCRRAAPCVPLAAPALTSLSTELSPR